MQTHPVVKISNSALKLAAVCSITGDKRTGPPASVLEKCNLANFQTVVLLAGGPSDLATVDIKRGPPATVCVIKKPPSQRATRRFGMAANAKPRGGGAELERGRERFKSTNSCDV